jgi:septal ring-binding cell division protein DamX
MGFKTAMTAALVAGLLASGCGGGSDKDSSAEKATASNGQAVQADATAKASARTAVSEMEACFVDAASYAGCKPSGADAEVSGASASGYTVMVKSASGNSFVIAKTASGLTRTCTAAGRGGCDPSGAW